MKLSKPPNIQSIERPKQTDWFTFITDDRVKLVIPVGPRFQVEVPSWTIPFSRSGLTIGDSESDNSKWIGTPIWPVKGRSQDINNNTVRRGRSEICECAFPGSIECVRQHISDKKFQLQIDLGPAFWKWKFDSMGEDVSKLWNPEEQKKFEYVVKMNATSRGRSFMESALECFPCQSKESIVSYYLNVYIPRRISVQTRSSCIMVDTDDDTEDMPRLKGSRKRFQANSFTSGSSKYIKTTYLTSRR
ncbi:hypothetical protein Pfo_018296 [Paulownia fortunei]|nr:hypothetical protein Pfo_018296 [Paulownia fortunei]